MKQQTRSFPSLLFWDFQFAVGHGLCDIAGVSAIDRASNRLEKNQDKYTNFIEILIETHHASTQDLLDSSSQITCLGSAPHDASNVDNFIESNVAIVLD